MKRISGTTGKFLRPQKRIDCEAWFAEFKKTNGNFGLGFQPMNEVRFIEALETTARL